MLDPVFLIREEWQAIAPKVAGKKKYCLIYAMTDYSAEEDAQIRQFARKHNLEIVIMPDNRRNHNNFYRKAFDLSPTAFLQCISNAEAVFTNSFHGMAFALIFGRQFTLLSAATKGGQSRRNRMTDLLTHLKIEGHCQVRDIEQTLDYDRINQELDQNIAASKAYLADVLEEEEK